jgi:hypothetical protein
MLKRSLSIVVFMIVAAVTGSAQDSAKAIPAGAKVFVNPMKDGFDAELTSSLKAKKVPVEIVTDKSQAEFEINGTSESVKASAAKIILMGPWQSSEQASITVTNLATGETVWAYSVNKQNSAHGKRSTAEACAKHLKDRIGNGKRPLT